MEIILMLKICTKCKKELTLDKFTKDAQKKCGLRPSCRACAKEFHKLYYAKPESKEIAALWNKNHYEEKKIKTRIWRANNRDEINRKKREYHKDNPEKVKAWDKRTYEKNKEIHAARNKARYEKNKQKIHGQMKERYHTDIQYKLSLNLRRRMHKLIRREDRNGSAVRDLGCSLEEFKSYIESKFTEGMTWGNYGVHGWHLDHIYPLSRVDLQNIEQFLKVAHYTNYQPLWAKDNISKGNKIVSVETNYKALEKL